MAKYEFTKLQVQNLRALIMDANIKGSAATAVAEVLRILKTPLDEGEDSDLHGEHNDAGKQGTDQFTEDSNKGDEGAGI